MMDLPVVVSTASTAGDAGEPVPITPCGAVKDASRGALPGRQLTGVRPGVTDSHPARRSLACIADYWWPHHGRHGQVESSSTSL